MSYLKKFVRKFLNLFNELRNLSNNFSRLNANKTLANLYISKRKIYKNQDYILCDALWDNPHHWLRLAIVGPILEKHFNANLAGLYSKNISKKVLKTFKSYKFHKYFEVANSKNKPEFSKAKELSKKVKTSEDIFKLDLPYDYPPQFLYDSILKMEMIGTIKNSKINLNSYINELIFYLEEYNEIFKKNNFRAILISHPVHFRFSTLVCIALNYKVPVYIMNYINEFISIRKLNSINDWTNGSQEKPELDKVLSLSEVKKNYLEDLGKQYLKDLRTAKKGQIGITGTFKKIKNKDFNRNEFLKKINLDPNKTTGLIMTGCWPDFPNISPPTWYLDYVDWFKKTIKIINHLDQFNWIIKPHPAEYMYGSKTKASNFLKTNKYNHIALWPEYLPTNYVTNIADVIVTSHGTAGIEYTALGLPVILTKKSYFSDWKFINYCPSFEKYERLLSNLNSIKKPSTELRTLANIFIATNFCNGAKVNEKYLYDLGAKGQKLWPTISKFIKMNSLEILNEQNMIMKWLNSDIQSYNFYKSINYDNWELK